MFPAANALLTTLTALPMQRRLTVLIFHRVVPEHDPMNPDEPDIARFEWMVRTIQALGPILPLRAAIEHTQRGDLPPKAFALTFDDGYADNLTHAVPVLRACGANATFFIATGFLNGGLMWNDAIIEAIRRAPAGDLDLRSLELPAVRLDDDASRYAAVRTLLRALKHRPPAVRTSLVARVVERAGAALPSDLMLTDAGVRGLVEAGMDVGAHTMSHPILSTLDRSTARAEIVEGRRRVEAIIGRDVPLFAYPNGVPDQDYTFEHVELVKEAGFTAAVSTSWGTFARGNDPYQIPRFTPWGATRARIGLNVARNLLLHKGRHAAMAA